MSFLHLHPFVPLRKLAQKLEILVRGRLWLQVMIGLVLGIAVGVALGPDVGWVSAEKAKVVSKWLALPGQFFLRLIKMVVVPLIIASIIRGIGASPDLKKLRSVGIRLILFVVTTTCFAATLGIILAKTIEPGTYIQINSVETSGEDQIIAADTEEFHMAAELPTFLAELIPDNPFASMMNGEMLGIVIFSILIGIAFAGLPHHKTSSLMGVLDSLLDICMTVVKWAMFLAPWAVFGLIAQMAAQVGINTLLGMGVYVGTVLGGLLILLLLYYSLVWSLGRYNPFSFAAKIGGAQLLAFSTSSSAAVMPVSIKTAEKELGIEPSISEFVIPLGATINMAGTALYQAVAVIFLAQVAGIELATPQIFFIIMTLVLSSIGSPATPGIGVVILSGIAVNFGIPLTGFALILGVDRIVDMCRTVLNVTGDLTACLILDDNRKPGKIKEILRDAHISMTG